jgi:hypothetical protein
MPNNGIVSQKINIPTKFRATSINEFDNSTDMVVINKSLPGNNVEQSAVTLNQLAGLVGGGESGPQGIQGPQGIPGPAVPAGLDWKGGYNAGLTYELNDVVTFLNPDTNLIGSYWVTVATITGTPPTDEEGIINTGWAFLASQGAQGIQGIQGLQGEVGPQGPAGTSTPPYKEVFLRTNYASSIQYGYSTLTSNTLTIAQNATGDYILNIQNPVDRPTNIYKIEVNADCVGGYGIENDIWRVAVDASFASAGQIRFYTYKYNTTTNVWAAAVPLSTWHPVHIRIYS